jgi:hypothetical protein
MWLEVHAPEHVKFAHRRYKEVMNRRMSSRSVSLTSTFLLLAAGGAAACDRGNDNRSVGAGAFLPFIWYSPLYRPGYAVGQRLPAGGNKFAYNDRAARQSFGLPPSGKIGNGTIKTSVVGKGGSGTKGSSKKSGG